MMLLGSLSAGRVRMPCLIGIQRDRVFIVAQDDLTRYSWPVSDVKFDANQTALILARDEAMIFTPDMPDRFRWVMTAALEEAATRRSGWWRPRKGRSIRGLTSKLATLPPTESAAA